MPSTFDVDPDALELLAQRIRTPLEAATTSARSTLSSVGDLHFPDVVRGQGEQINALVRSLADLTVPLQELAERAERKMGDTARAYRAVEAHNASLASRAGQV